MFKYKGLMFPLFLFLFGILLLFIIIPNQIIKYDSSSIVNERFLPIILSIMIIIFGFILSLKELKNGKSKGSVVESTTVDLKYKIIRVLSTFIFLVLWTYFLPILGYVLTSFFFIGGLMLIIGNRILLQIILVSSIFTGVSYYIFKYILTVNLPEGIFL